MKPRRRYTTGVTIVPRTRRQRTPPSSVDDAIRRPANPTSMYGRTLSEAIGRIPTIGIDPGAQPGTRPDQSPINNR